MGIYIYIMGIVYGILVEYDYEWKIHGIGWYLSVIKRGWLEKSSKHMVGFPANHVWLPKGKDWCCVLFERFVRLG
jgi:hypothetical protein